MTTIITQKNVSTNDENIEFGRRRYKASLKTIGWIGVILPLFSFKSANDFFAPILINLPFSDSIFSFLVSMEEIFGSNRLLLWPLALMVLAAGYFAGFGERKSAQKRLDSINSMKKLEELDWRSFEEILADYYLLKGYRVTLAGGGGGGGDGGIDLIIRKGFKKIIVQAKHYKNNVGVSIVREMLGVMKIEKAHKVIICTTAGFSKEAVQTAKNQPVQLIKGEEILGMFMSINSVNKKNK